MWVELSSRLGALRKFKGARWQSISFSASWSAMILAAPPGLPYHEEQNPLKWNQKGLPTLGSSAGHFITATGVEINIQILSVACLKFLSCHLNTYLDVNPGRTLIKNSSWVPRIAALFFVMSSVFAGKQMWHLGHCFRSRESSRLKTTQGEAQHIAWTIQRSAIVFPIVEFKMNVENP